MSICEYCGAEGMDHDYQHIARECYPAMIKAKNEKIERLERQLAESDQLIATHANAIDSNHPSTWPPGSLLAAAIERHDARCAVAFTPAESKSP